MENWVFVPKNHCPKLYNGTRHNVCTSTKSFSVDRVTLWYMQFDQTHHRRFPNSIKAVHIEIYLDLCWLT